MLIKTTAIVKWNYNIKKHYISKGYIYTKMGDEFEVKVEDLTPSSEAIIECLCDYCLHDGINKRIDKPYHRYLKEDINCIIDTQSCNDCCDKKKIDIINKKQELGLLTSKDVYYWTFRENRLKELQKYILKNNSIDNIFKNFKPMGQAINSYNENIIDMVYELGYNIEDISSNINDFYFYLKEEHIINIFNNFIKKFGYFPSNEEIHKIIKFSYYGILRFGGIKHIKELVGIHDDYNDRVNLNKNNIVDLYEFRNKSGIYKITNIIQNKVYIGQGANLWERIRGGYIDSLPKNKNHNKHLQNAWNKYGEDNFIIDIIEICEVERLNEREQYWIDFYKSYDINYGYNICKEAGSCRGYKNSEKEIERKRKYMLENNPMKGKKHTKEIKELLSDLKSIPILRFDKEGNFLDEWNSAIEASNALNIHAANITSVTNGKSLWTHSFLFCKKEDYESGKYKVDEILDKIKYQKEHHHLAKMILQYDLKGNFIQEWISVTEICKQTNFNNSTIFANLTKRQETACGFIWKYKDDYPTMPNKIKTGIIYIEQYTLNEEFVAEYNSFTQIEKKFKGFYHNKTKQCCEGLIKNAYGYIWRYKEY